ncbi:MAG: hypothetical protein GVY28_01260 [Alphaproteobacteria bacterium]|jgi:hypothetical protein|nr:hypothetical protein [Alphaproteobacteria bacterium]
MSRQAAAPPTRWVLVSVLAAATLTAAIAAAAPSTEAPTAPPGPPPTWERTFGSPVEDKAYGVRTTPDGGAVIVGNTRSTLSRRDDAWIMRVDERGDVQWRRQDGGRDTDQVYGIDLTAEGDVLVAGHTRSAGAGESDAWLLFLDRTGQMAWQRTYGGAANDRARTVIALPDGGGAFAGFSASGADPDAEVATDRDAWVVRFDADGAVLWERRFGGSGDDGVFHLAAAPDGGLVAVGHAQHPDTDRFQPWAVRLDADGGTLWQRRFGDDRFAAATGVAVMPDGGIAMVGLGQAERGHRDDIRLFRLDAAGDLLWESRFGGPGMDNAWGIAHAGDGVVVAGATASQGAGSTDAWLLGVDGDGAMAWEAVHGGALWDRPTAIARHRDGRLLVVGVTTSRGAGYEDWWMLALDAEGRF